ncbi:hypothetical protein FSP39_022195 [Pinctada imbricata]|uniref:Uncharacterized protein n=1 Tax=Pinctada imbricata TaxID=66713 RepID=A0AA88Y8I0_PINIB|nr:hypothetical protein FSP39_022195 [Pinctada imbricata]
MYFPSTKATHVNVKHLRSNHIQYDVNLRQTSSFSRLPLSIQYDSHRGYARPVNYNRLNSYIYLGFLPKTAASAKVTQGYKANKKDFTFRNCDGNPNSYLVFYHNNDSSAPFGYYKRCCYTKLMRGWIDQSKPAKTFLPADYFFQTEMHMGGCGGYAVSGYNTQTDIYGAALGIPFGKTKNVVNIFYM